MSARRFGAAVALVLAAGACSGAGARTETEKMSGTAAQAPKIAAQMGITIPADATVDYAEPIEGRDSAARLVLVLPEAAWASWRGQLVPTGPDQPPFTALENYELGADQGGWTPSKAPGLTTTQVHWRGSESLNIGQSPTGDGRVRVFLFWFQT